MSRATKSGINLDQQKKLEANYDPSAEQKAREWLEAVTGEDIGPDFFGGLKDGSYLCRALNRLQPGLVKPDRERSKKATFQQIETIGDFLAGCKKYGMGEKDLFVSMDLYEQQNRNMVIATIFALGRQAQKNGYEGPVLGPKEAEPAPREFTEEQLRESQKHSSLLTSGTNKGASATGSTPYGLPRQVQNVNLKGVVE